MTTLAEVFAQTGGPDPLSPVVPDTEPGVAFLSNFSTAQYTGAHGNGPILNAHAVLMPSVAGNYDDNSTINDYRLGNGLGISRPFGRPDSMGGQVDGGQQGNPYPNKMFGRSTTSHDQNLNRLDHRERAQMNLKKMGFKDGEVPKGSHLQPWVWQNNTALGIGSAMQDGRQGNQYNRHYGVPDADAVARRMYTPTPSRMTQMLAIDIEDVQLRPSRTLLHPMKYVSEDKQRDKYMRIPRNADVHESVVYENIVPRGMGRHNQAGPRIYGRSDVLKQPVGSNETGDRSIYGIWKNASHSTDPLAASTLEDRLTLFRDFEKNCNGRDIDRELREYANANTRLDSQSVYDPNGIQPTRGEYEYGNSTPSGPLKVYQSAGRVI